VSVSTHCSIVGASGYVGGELLRLLLDHPHVEVAQATSERLAGQLVPFKHPNLRGRTALKFSALDELAPCDVLFVALPHGQAQQRIEALSAKAEILIDLSADFRIRDPERYHRWYGKEHQRPEWIERFVYGLPELHRDTLRSAKYASGVGCNATATNLAILPLVRAGLLDLARGVVCEVKVGSSEGGHEASDASHHPERSGSVRSFAPTGHRHTAEVEQALEHLGASTQVHLSATAVELVRGVLATAHAFVNAGVTERDLYKAYRDACASEPFLRLVKEKRGIYRYPEPKILAGSNIAELGFELDERTGRVVAIAAIDNLMKGAAGTAVQCLNLMQGWDETTGLTFPGLHPI
jgi:N-acetyl-gamma-glutamyl-phosphate/LysW-gamma-L-alpha-aminoadipyl-6-phosphate reductase